MARKSASASGSMKPFYVALAVVAVAGVAFILWQMRAGGSGGAATQPIPVQISDAELNSVQGISIGRQDAPVVIYEFADFQCPGCGQFATFTAPLIKERLVETGQVRFVYYDFPLPQHQHAFLAARAARCANEQGKFWEYHDVLYARQPTWAVLRNATDFFIDLAEEIGLDESAFSSCLRSDRYQEEVSRSIELGERLGVRSTPTLMVNMKRLPDVPDFSQLQQMVEQELGAPAAAADSAAGATAP